MKKLFWLLLSACLLLLCLSGCGNTAYNYPDADLYTVGGAELPEETVAGITHVVIDWVAGSVNVTAAEGGTISISETGENELPDEYRLRYRVNEGVLYIRYAAVAYRPWTVKGKDLTVTLPASMTPEMVHITCSSADVRLSGVCGTELKVGTSSGSVDVDEGCRFTYMEMSTSSGAVGTKAVCDNTMDVSTSSGSIFVRTDSPVDTLKLSASSGKIDVDVGTVGLAEINTTSGEITVNAEKTDRMDVGSSSGDVTVIGQDVGLTVVSVTSGDVTLTAVAAAGISVDTSSGRVELTLPSELGFTLKADTSSGDISYDIPMSKNGDKYVYGDGACPIEVSTSSGNIRISTAK